MSEGEREILVGAAGFEPATSCAQGKRATRLRHAPTLRVQVTGFKSHAASFLARAGRLPTGNLCSIVPSLVIAVNCLVKRLAENPAYHAHS